MDSAGYTGWVEIETVSIDWEPCNECENLYDTILFRNFFQNVLPDVQWLVSADFAGLHQSRMTGRAAATR